MYVSHYTQPSFSCVLFYSFQETKLYSCVEGSVQAVTVATETAKVGMNYRAIVRCVRDKGSMVLPASTGIRKSTG